MCDIVVVNCNSAGGQQVGPWKNFGCRTRLCGNRQHQTLRTPRDAPEAQLLSTLDTAKYMSFEFLNFATTPVPRS